MTSRITIYPTELTDKEDAALVLVVHSEQAVERVPLTKREALALCRDIIRGLE